MHVSVGYTYLMSLTLEPVFERKNALLVSWVPHKFPVFWLID